MSATAVPPQPLLCLPGPENWYNYDGDFSVHGQPIKLVQEGGQVQLCVHTLHKILATADFRLP